MHTAVVTGGSRGIGRAIATAILADGGRVMITGRDEARLGRAVQELEAQAAGRVAGFQLDVRDPSGAESLVNETIRRFGGLDTLVNNAGLGRFVDVSEMTPDEWQDVIATNLSGPFYCSRAALPLLKQQGGGWIINIASLAGTNPFGGGAAYCASKAGLIAFSEALMQEVRFDNIRVSVILPGSVDTEFSSRSREADTSWKLTPEDVAQVVTGLLAHPARSLPSRVEIRPAKTRGK